LLVEGTFAKITNNQISKNLKANIAFGGRNSGKTKIEMNEIKHSTAEGIFVVEGEESTLIFENNISSNKDGILVLNS